MGLLGSRWVGEGLDGVVTVLELLQKYKVVKICRVGAEGLDGLVRV